VQLLAISGSLRAASSNTALLRGLAHLAPKDLRVEIFEGLGALPHFDPGLDTDRDTPEPVRAFRERVKGADGLIICTPEYAAGMPGVLKNALDWLVSYEPFAGKATATISASPSMLGGDKAHASLRLVLSVMSANLIHGADLTVPFVKSKLNAQGEVVDEALKQSLESLLKALMSGLR
jgi:chromate reductase, NAD(P)H dehydrogenase (quinone)